MISFEIELTAFEFDADEYKKRVQLNIERQVKEAAAKWLQAVLRAIPTFNPPPGGIHSDRSTGFVAGAFTNLKLALGSVGGFTPGGPTGEFETPPHEATVRQIHKAGGIVARKIPGLIPITREAGTARPLGRESQVLGARLFEEFLNANKNEHPPSVTSPKRRLRRDIIRKGKQISVRIRNEFYTGSGTKVLKTPRSGTQFATDPEQVFKTKGRSFVFRYSVDIDYFSIQDVRNIRKSRYAPWKAFEAGDKAFNDYMFRKGVTQIFPKIESFFVKKTYKVDTKGGINISQESTKFQK